MPSSQGNEHLLRSRKIDQLGMRAFVRDAERARGVEWQSIIEKCQFAAFHLLEMWLGGTWAHRHLVEKHDFFSAREGAEFPPHYHARTLELAELLYNMQHVPGFEFRLKATETDGIEGAIAELQGARFLFGNNVPFSFREPDASGTYDVDAELGGPLCVEMKGKMEGKEPRWRSVRESVGKSRTQLLSDRPGLTLIRVPDHWVKTQFGRDEILKGIGGVFDRSQRINAVVVHWEEWSTTTGGDVKTLGAVTAIHNKTRHPSQELLDFVRILPGMRRTGWKLFQEVVCTREELVDAGWPIHMLSSHHRETG